jgi:hypothetical protein
MEKKICILIVVEPADLRVQKDEYLKKPAEYAQRATHYPKYVSPQRKEQLQKREAYRREL